LIQAVNGELRLIVRDINTGDSIVLTTNLAGPPSGNIGVRVPLGVSLLTTRDGVRIESVTIGSPATRCVDLQTGQTGLRLEVDDIILAVNGVSAIDQQQAVRLVNQTERILNLTVRDHKSGQIYELQTELRNQ
jgi:S1-C subfamily serine protease